MISEHKKPMSWGYAGVFPGEFRIWDGDALFNKLQFMVDHGFASTGISLAAVEDDDLRGRVADFVQTHQLNLTPHVALPYFDAPMTECWKRVEIASRQLADWKESLNLSLVVICAGKIHRYQRDPDLKEQIRLLSRALTPLAEACHDLGIPIGIENHADYWISDLVEVCDQTPHLGIFLDTGNCCIVGEKPIPAAREAARLVVGTHFKDHIVYPSPQGGLSFEIKGATFGEGDVGLHEIYEILRTEHPAPETIQMQFELVPDPADPWASLERSKRFVEELDGYAFRYPAAPAANESAPVEIVSEPVQPLKAILVGTGGMGTNQAKLLARLPEFELTAICDLNGEAAHACAQQVNARAYTDFAEALRIERPDTVSICTGNNSHASLTIQAAEAGVRGIYCEKPMAVSMGEARAMVEACDRHDVRLVINHQRRVGADLLEAKRLIDSGALGRLVSLEGACAGDILSDGTHVVDSLMFLAGDPEVEWVVGQIYRSDEYLANSQIKRGADAPGFRYGHAVEEGGLGRVMLGSGVTIDIRCGDLSQLKTYQEYEIRGTKGRLWRVGDRIDPNLFLEDNVNGTHVMRFDAQRFLYRPMPVPDGKGQWRPIESKQIGEAGGSMVPSYQRFYRTVTEGEPNPMDGHIAQRGFEIVMAIYESARLREKITMPLMQDRFPLEVMLESATPEFATL